MAEEEGQPRPIDHPLILQRGCHIWNLGELHPLIWDHPDALGTGVPLAPCTGMQDEEDGHHGDLAHDLHSGEVGLRGDGPDLLLLDLEGVPRDLQDGAPGLLGDIPGHQDVIPGLLGDQGLPGGQGLRIARRSQCS